MKRISVYMTREKNPDGSFYRDSKGNIEIGAAISLSHIFADEVDAIEFEEGTKACKIRYAKLIKELKEILVSDPEPALPIGNRVNEFILQERAQKRFRIVEADRVIARDLNVTQTSLGRCRKYAKSKALEEIKKEEKG